MSVTSPQPPPPTGVSTSSTTDVGSTTDDQTTDDLATVDTPKLLNRWQLVGTAIAVVFGVLSATLQFVGYSADGRAADDTEQLVRVQGVQSSLLRADALATNAFLIGGLEPTEQRAEYDDAIDTALSGITDAADAQPADREALAALNLAVNEYVATVAQARTNNRQGLPIGAEYLSGASADLRAEALPILEELVDANTERAGDSMGGQQPLLIVLVGLVALAGLWWLNRLLARTFRRHVNVGVTVAAVVVAVTTVVTAVVAFIGSASNDDLRDEAFRTAVDQAAARTAANDAKANESLRLVKRGSGGEFEVAWQDSAQVVADRGADELAPRWAAYVEAHEAIVQQDENGNWEAAVELATSPAEDGATATLDAYDAASQQVVDEAAAEATDALRGGRWFTFLLGLVTLVAGAAAAVSIARGIGARRREFA